MLSVSHPPFAHRYLNDQPQQQQPSDVDPRQSAQTPRSLNQPFSLPSVNLNQPFDSLTSGALPDSSLNADTWGNMAQLNSDKGGTRLPHQRESSLSSMGSTGPASPYNANTSNPQIAITDSTGDELADIHAQEAANQNGALWSQIGKPAANPFLHQNMNQAMPEMAYPVTIAGPNAKSGTDRGLLPAPDVASAGRPQPPAANSISAADPHAASANTGESEPTNKRRKDAFGNAPKLDRTMTDIYGDELYSPNFTITSTPPSQSQQLTTISPSNDVFSQRLNAANSQHLNVGHSPATAASTDTSSSPFRPSSPLVKSSNQDFGPPQNPRTLNPTHNMREPNKAQHDFQMLQQQVGSSGQPETPKTISPKDAMLEFSDPDGDTDFPLFPPQQPSGFDVDLSKMVPTQPNPPQFMAGGNGLVPGDQFTYLPSQMHAAIQVPQQYPFISRMQPSSNASPPRLSSSGSSSDSGGSTPMVRPMGTGAEAGTYTCTYHGCTLRFETPAMLQKHKREGHRQTHGLPPTRPDIGMTTNLLSSQAGPHRCDRINPSTGKPCGTVFSRPYDLTRHEDTIHNARKQKVRCDLCTEEKTFSRADALTRHYRVCHPDMELPGKHRRRGG